MSYEQRQVTKTHVQVLNMLNTWKVVATVGKCQLAEVDVMTFERVRRRGWLECREEETYGEKIVVASQMS